MNGIVHQAPVNSISCYWDMNAPGGGNNGFLLLDVGGPPVAGATKHIRRLQYRSGSASDIQVTFLTATPGVPTAAGSQQIIDPIVTLPTVAFNQGFKATGSLPGVHYYIPGGSLLQQPIREFTDWRFVVLAQRTPNLAWEGTLDFDLEVY